TTLFRSVSSESTCCGQGCIDCTTLYANGVGTCNNATCVFVSCKAGFHTSGGSCLADSCSDSIKNQDETGVDCGGTCVAQGKTCPNGAGCVLPADCASQYCSGHVCASCSAGTHLCSNSCLSNTSPNSCGSSCASGSHACSNACVSNTSTSSCGASCTPCAPPGDVNAHATCDGTSCGVACNAGFHPAGGSCIEDSCADGIRNQNESDVDCGGTCVAQGKTCATGAACVTASDCTTRYCPA